MSLKALHLFTVLIAVVACSAYGMWHCLAFVRAGDAISLAIGVSLLAGGLALVMHGVIFYKHTEEEPWL